MEHVITRFAPSPTGTLHVGSVRAALFNYFFARKHKGKFILRFEDTDKERSKKEYEEDILKGLEWLSLEFDEIHHQSERTVQYEKYLRALLEKGVAYEGEDSESGGGKVIRLKNQGGVVTFHDLLRGDISVDTEELGDFIIARNIQEPLYHFAVVVDDFEMGVTHVIRGEDGIYNTPRQIRIQEALGAPRPLYCHFPFVLGEDKSKLSKRHGALSVNEYKEMGILPEAIVNYLAFLGWNPGGDQEIYEKGELVHLFDLERLQKAPAVFTFERLLFFNREHLKKLPDKTFEEEVRKRIGERVATLPQFSEERLLRVLPDLRERISTLKEIENLFENGEYDFCFSTPTITEDLLPEKTLRTPEGKMVTKEYLLSTEKLLKALPEKPSKESVKTLLWDYATEKGRGVVLWPLRYALSGKERSPDPFTLIAILGKEEVGKRIAYAIQHLS